jgi:hypothetical protein
MLEFVDFSVSVLDTVIAIARRAARSAGVPVG